MPPTLISYAKGHEFDKILLAPSHHKTICVAWSTHFIQGIVPRPHNCYIIWIRMVTDNETWKGKQTKP